MRYQPDQRITFGTASYQIVRPLGNGALAEVYEVLLGGTELRAVLKVLRGDRRPGGEEAEGLRHEAQVLRRLNAVEDPASAHLAHVSDRLRYALETEARRQVVMLFDDGEAETGVPFLIQELAPDEFEAPEVASLEDERRILIVMHAVSRVLVLAHSSDLALKDFDPRTKYDRIRVRWLNDGDQPAVKVIDWNVTGRPEDWPDDLFLFGGHFYHLLLGRYLALGADGRPPANLGMGTPAWAQISEGSRQILGRLLHRNPERRYQQAVQLEADLNWLLQMVSLARDPSTLRRLPDQAWNAKAQGRHDRVLAVADLVLRQDATAATRQMLQTLQKEARDKLEDELWHPIAECRSSLLAGLFSQAVACFDRALRTLDPRGEAARLARLLRIQAATGQALKEGGLANVLETREWSYIVQAVTAILDQQWDLAERRMQDLQGNGQVRAILDQARAGRLYGEAMALQDRAREHPADASHEDWLTIYAGKRELLRQAVAKLEEALKLAPDEILFEDALVQVQARIQEREQLQDCYEQVDRYRAEADELLARPEIDRYERATEPLRNSVDILRRILDVDGQQFRAQFLMDRQGYRLSFVEAMAKVQSVLAGGHYVEAGERVAAAQHIFRQERSAQNLSTEVIAGASLERRAQDLLDTAASTLQAGNFLQAAQLAGRVVSMQGKALAASDISISVSLSEAVGLRPFRLRTDLEKRAREIEARATFLHETNERIEEAWQRGEYAVLITTLADLGKRHDGLSVQHQQRLDEARERLSRLDQAVKIVESAGSFEDLIAGLNSIPAGDPSAQAAVLRRQAADRWRSLVYKMEDLEEAQRRIEEGRERFAGLPQAQSLAQAGDIIGLARRAELDLPLPEVYTDGDMRDRLVRLDAALHGLLGTQSWPVVQRQAAAWRKEIVDFLERELRTRRDQALADLQNRAFVEAERRALMARELVPEQLWDRLPPDLREGLANIQAKAGKGVRLGKAWKDLVSQLEAGTLSFREAADLLPSPPEGIDLPVETAWLKQIDHAKEKELARQQRPTPKTFARIIHEQQEAFGLPAVVTDAFYGDRAPMTFRRLSDLNDSLRVSVNRLADELMEAVDAAAGRLIEFPTALPADLLALYWQVRWLRVALVPKAHDAKACLDRAVATAHTLAEKLRDAIVALEGSDSLAVAQERLAVLRQYNDGLSVMPTSEGQPLLELPPLPADTTDDYRLRCLDGDTLGQIDGDIEALLALASRRVESPDNVSSLLTPEEATPLPDEAPVEPTPETAELLKPTPLGRLKALFRRRGARGQSEHAKELGAPSPEPAIVAAGPRLAPAIALAEAQTVIEVTSRLDRCLDSLATAFKRLGHVFSSPALDGLRAEASRLTELARLLARAEAHRVEGRSFAALQSMEEIRRLSAGLDARWTWLLGVEQRILKTGGQALDSRLDADLQVETRKVLGKLTAAHELEKLLALASTGPLEKPAPRPLSAVPGEPAPDIKDEPGSGGVTEGARDMAGVDSSAQAGSPAWLPDKSEGAPSAGPATDENPPQVDLGSGWGTGEEYR